MTEVWKLAFVGEPGSGKTTCIGAVSDIAPVCTDVECTDELAQIKATTTVALDYGEIDLGSEGRLLLYGLPGQARFRYMFDVIRENLLGIAVLVDGASADPLRGLSETLGSYLAKLRELPFVICVNKVPGDSKKLLLGCRDVLREFGLIAPILTIDARRRADVVRVFELLFTLLEHARPSDHWKGVSA